MVWCCVATKDVVNSTVAGLPAFIQNETNKTALADLVCDLAKAKDKVTCEEITEIVLQDPKAILDDFTFEAMAGTINGSLAVDTYPGIYWFSVAVWMTLLGSAFINSCSDLVQSEIAAATGATEEAVSKRSLRATSINDRGPEAPAKRSLLCSSNLSLAQIIGVAVFLVVTASAVLLGMLLPLITRHVTGSVTRIADLLLGQSYEVGFEKNESLIGTIASCLGGGSNSFLQKDLILFMVIAPAFFVLASFVALLVPMHPKSQGKWVKAACVSFSFSGWEAMAIVLVIFGIQQKSLTKVLVMALGTGFVQTCMDLTKAIPNTQICFQQNSELHWASFSIFLVAIALLFALNWMMQAIYQRKRLLQTQLTGRSSGVFGYEVLEDGAVNESGMCDPL